MNFEDRFEDLLVSPSQLYEISDAKDVVYTWLATRKRPEQLDHKPAPTPIISRRILAELGVNVGDFKNIVHIVGSSGKGTATLALAAILRQSGFKVAVITKPHLLFPSERIMVEDYFIHPYKFVDYLEKVNNASLRLYPNYRIKYVQLMFLAGITFLYENFRNHLDFLIVEAGIGLKNDYSNVFSGLQQNYYLLLTSIQRLHTKRLGRTLKEILLNKTSEAKYARKTFYIGDSHKELVFQNVNNVLVIDDEFRVDVEGGIVSSLVHVKKVRQGAKHQRARGELFAEFGVNVPEDTARTIGKLVAVAHMLTKGFSTPARLYLNLVARLHPLGRLGKNTFVVVDSAHEYPQYKRVVRWLQNISAEFGVEPRLFVATLGSAKRRFWRKYANMLVGLFSTSRRALSTYRHFRMWKALRRLGTQRRTQKNTFQLVLCTGSVYTIGDCLEENKVLLHPFEQESVLQRVALDRQFLRFLYKAKRLQLTTEEWNKAQEEYVNKTMAILDSIYTSGIRVNKAAVFAPMFNELNPAGILPHPVFQRPIVFYPQKDPRHFKGYAIVEKSSGKTYKDFGEAGFNEGGIIFLPGLVFDKMGKRVGYGGGVYDYWLRRLDHIYIDPYLGSRVYVQSHSIPAKGEKFSYNHFLDPFSRRFLISGRRAHALLKQRSLPLVIPVRFEWELQPWLP